MGAGEVSYRLSPSCLAQRDHRQGEMVKKNPNFVAIVKLQEILIDKNYKHFFLQWPEQEKKSTPKLFQKKENRFETP